MSEEPAARLPRYTWAWNYVSCRVTIYRREGMFDTGPHLRIDDPEHKGSSEPSKKLIKLANAICDMLDREDREDE